MFSLVQLIFFIFGLKILSCDSLKFDKNLQSVKKAMKPKMLGGRNWKKRCSETSDTEDFPVLPNQRCIESSNS